MNLTRYAVKIEGFDSYNTEASKIHQIKMVRELFDLGLLDSKNLVEKGYSQTWNLDADTLLKLFRYCLQNGKQWMIAKVEEIPDATKFDFTC